ncbi:MAG: ATP-binding protein [Cyclobacteriaceae bacterium]|nr:ATP-binding protein [Cyclobacteriaceae bacterium]MCK5206994.1 ATP-binding protein [Cyclobacteriaceae bacterium]MCK5281584.1 ATP-binding protein [Cyclobacteriaceae bacterium]MCK5371337.1 ATP-binding protein [Cyclobacteriaceae bacterium]MCK5468776.1 ATP-binding protein [Cyclobacteriaceae bacterium]
MLPTNFQAKKITTKLSWDDLVLLPDTFVKIHEVEKWINKSDSQKKKLGIQRKLKRGYSTLFYGPSGSGKTLTATILGKVTHRDVYKFDLSMMVSKYIGETEKNLSHLFDRAENKDWILFFDEADALFGKRTEGRDAHDRYVNEEVSYLLQRIEEYNGLVILATNFRENIDEAIIRRLNTIIYFPKPNSRAVKDAIEKPFQR